MIILSPYQAKIIVPLRRNEIIKSEAQTKNILGHENQIRFCVTARLDDGHIAWRGWFDDQDDFDTFLWSMARGTLKQDRYVQRLCTPEWRPELLEFPLSWEWHTYLFIVSLVYPGVNPYPVPSNCRGVSGKSGEFIDCVGGGGSGGGRHQLFGASRGLGGGGGAWSRVTVLELIPNANVTVNLGSAAAGVLSTGSGVTGNAGSDTWFNGANLAASSVGAKGGSGGPVGTGTTLSGGTGGDSASGTGTTKNSGGDGGDVTVTSGADSTGGGAAGGMNGVGGNGVDNANTGFLATAGGNVPSGASGTAGTPSAGSSTPTAGTEYDGTHGIGAGAGSSVNMASAGLVTGNGGAYGGASGGYSSGNNTAATTGSGGAPIIVMAFEPPLALMPFRKAVRFFNRRF